MSTSKHFNRICIIVLVLSLLLTTLFVNGRALGIQLSDTGLGYENRLFDTTRVHTIDLVMDDWDGFIQTCTNEEYALCSAVIDGESYKNLAIRGKGNTSLSSVSAMDSERYSFKIEFDHYETGKTYHGLDKLSLNNIIQDNTYMKDYLTYRLMAEFGVDTPLCSFVYITVNGEDWGLYLAVEGVEDSFLQRNYGAEAGELYKPDSMSFGGGGPGNGKNFNMEDFFKSDDHETDSGLDDTQGFSMPENSSMPDFGGSMPDFGGSMPDFGGNMPSFGDMPGSGPASDSDASASDASLSASDSDARPEPPDSSSGFDFKGFDFNGAFGGMGSSDVKLQYIDDDPDSYSNIFANAKTAVSAADQKRLIASLKALSEGTDIESVVDVEEVIRYFVVHNFVCNGDSYTGSIVHNYYLHENDGQLSMIPWDYNLAFGTFQGADATGTVNDPIDTPMSVSDAADRPMWGWIISSEEYTALYHERFAEFLDTVDVQGIIDEAYQLIAPYVQKDPTAFCTCEEFEAGIAALKSFCALRTQSVCGQLDGAIPSTDEGQRADDSALVDASSLTLSDMGSMGGGAGGPGGMSGAGASADGGSSSGQSFPNAPADFQPGSGFQPPDGGQERPSGFPGTGTGGREMPNFAGGSFPGGAETSAASQSSWVLPALCAAVLLLGIVFAKRYRVTK